MLSLPHLVVLFVVALMVFGPEKLPELARMLGKATAEFRKMTSDFRYALEDEVRELERQTRIKQEESAAATQATQPTASLPAVTPEGAVSRDTSTETGSAAVEPQYNPSAPPHVDSDAPQPPSDEPPPETISVPHEKSSDDNTAV